MKTKLLVILLILASVSSGLAQTIAREEMPNLFFRFVRLVEANPSAEGAYDFTKIDEWKIINQTGDTKNRTTFELQESDTAGLWFNHHQNSFEDKPDVKKVMIYDWQKDPLYDYEFYFIHGLEEGEYSHHLLTIWEKIGSDSLRLSCVNPESWFGGYVNVAYVSILPDSSYLLVAHNIYGDGGEAYETYGFYKQTGECNFERFYSVDFYFSDYEPKAIAFYYLFDQMKHYDFTLSEIKEFSTYNIDEHGIARNKKIDSVQVNLLDLWQMASDSLGEGK